MTTLLAVLRGNNAGCRTAPTSYSIADSRYQVRTTSTSRRRPRITPFSCCVGERHAHELLNHLIGPRQQRRRDREAEGLILLRTVS